MVDSFSDLKVLVLGDIIFDEYETVQIQGLTSKNRILSGRSLYSNQQAGGALAVFRHALEFTKFTKFLSLVGTESWVEPTLRKFLPQESDLVIKCEKFKTIRKLRFVEQFKEGIELNKLFSVNYINDSEISPKAESKVLSTLSNIISDFDLILVMDFGHGLMTSRIRDLVRKKPSFISQLSN